MGIENVTWDGMGLHLEILVVSTVNVVLVNLLLCALMQAIFGATHTEITTKPLTSPSKLRWGKYLFSALASFSLPFSFNPPDLCLPGNLQQ